MYAPLSGSSLEENSLFMVRCKVSVICIVQVI